SGPTTAGSMALTRTTLTLTRAATSTMTSAATTTWLVPSACGPAGAARMSAAARVRRQTGENQRRRAARHRAGVRPLLRDPGRGDRDRAAQGLPAHPRPARGG